MDKKTKSSRVVIDTGYTSDERDLLLSQSLYAPNVINVYDQPSDYRILTLLSCIFCFLPLGLFGIFYSIKVRRLYVTGYYTKAAKASERTRFILQMTLLIGVALWLVGIVALAHVLSTGQLN